MTCDGRVLFWKEDWPFYLCSYDRDYLRNYLFGKYEIHKKKHISRAEKMETRPMIIGDIRQIIIYFGKLGDIFDDVCLFPLMILRNN